MKTKFNLFIKKTIRYFFQGVLFVFPIAITIWGLLFLFKFIDGLLLPYINKLININIPGLGIVFLILIILLIGFIGSSFIFKPIINFFDRLFTKAPLIKILYTSVKDLISAFVGNKKRFNEPVLVKLGNGYDVEKLGFVTNKDLTFLGLSDKKVAVYLPHSYNWSGNLFIVPIENITPINAPSTEVMKFIVSAGVTNIND